jgi:hypothetical protein
MNERINELEAQCWEARQYGPPWFNSKKFAELIVRECVRYFNEDYVRDFNVLWREDLSKGMKEHFGVEE